MSSQINTKTLGSDRDQEKINQLVTDVAIIKTKMEYTDERHETLVKNDEKILSRLDTMTVVKTDEFDAYKEHVENTYVTRAEISGLLKAWNIATNWITVTFIVAILVLAIVNVAKNTEIVERLT